MIPTANQLMEFNMKKNNVLAMMLVSAGFFSVFTDAFNYVLSLSNNEKTSLEQVLVERPKVHNHEERFECVIK